MPELSEVVSQVMSLPVTDRAALAHRLILSLEEERPRAVTEEDLEQTLLARQQRVRSGNYKAYDADDTLERIQRELTKGDEP
jgi:hypothetical protein